MGQVVSGQKNNQQSALGLTPELLVSPPRLNPLLVNRVDDAQVGSLREWDWRRDC